MKKLSTISLFIFGVVVTSVLTAGLVFYQNNKRNQNQISGSKIDVLNQEKINQLTSSGKSLILNMEEIKKHEKSSDCWILVSGNVYDITSFFGSHPGGNSTMSATCGTDATKAYMTKDPNATSTSGGQDHSANAKDMLKDYYLGQLNENIGTGISTTRSVATNSLIPKDTTPSTSSIKNITIKSVVSRGEITLNLSEIAKHNKPTDCFMLISGKVYNITSFFGSHPGGNSTMSPTCGTDATAAYMTQDPNAKTSGSNIDHSKNAQNMLTDYYIGDLNQTIGSQIIKTTNTIVPSTTKGEDDDDDDEWDD